MKCAGGEMKVGGDWKDGRGNRQQQYRVKGKEKET